jgi:hypothetical protein
MAPKVEAISQPTNGAAHTIEYEEPYVAEVKITGTAALLFHRWNDDAVEAKAKAAKGSRAKKEDDTGSYVWRDEEGLIAMPGMYLRGSLVQAGRFRQDPRSPRKSAMDLYKAAIHPLTDLAVVTNAAGEAAVAWDYLDRRRAVVQRNAITRVRPAFLAGWTATFLLQITIPEYVPPLALLDSLNLAGRLIGVGDFRPTFGRYVISSFNTSEA